MKPVTQEVGISNLEISQSVTEIKAEEGFSFMFNSKNRIVAPRILDLLLESPVKTGKLSNKSRVCRTVVLF